jgi:cell wall-associated NlpC family hydrolase
MTHAEQYSTIEPGACPARRKRTRNRVFATLAVASALGATSLVVASSTPASADQISDAKAQAAAISAKLNATEAQISALSGQVDAANYKLSQLQAQISANQAAVAKDQHQVARDSAQLETQAIADYTSSGTSNTATQLFTSNVNTSGIRSEYASIATGNVTTTIDRLHTAQAQLAATQSSLEQQKSQAQATHDQLESAQSQASALAAQDQSTLDSVNANIHQLVVQQQQAEAAAEAAAAKAQFVQKVQAAQAAQAVQAKQTVTSSGGGGTTTTQASGGSSGGGGSVSSAPVPPSAGGALGAVQAAESMVGVPYLWGGTTPAGFDCSGLVMWAYAQVGISLPHYSGAQYNDTTHIPLADIAPGDLLFYGPGGSEHVAMYVGGGSMVEAPYTGADVHITGVRTDGLAGVGRVV